MMQLSSRHALARAVAVACLIAGLFVFANAAHARGVFIAPSHGGQARTRLPMANDGGRAVRVVRRAWGGGARIIAEAERFLGQGNFTGTKGPWCADAISAWLKLTGRRPLPNRMAMSALSYGPHDRQPKPGDLAVFRGHVTIFVRYAGRGEFIGLGGNQGHRVRFSRYAVGRVVGFVHI